MIAGLLRLPEGQRVSSIYADWLRLGIGVDVEGGDLPEVAGAEHPGSVHPAGDVDLELRAKFEALVQRYDDAYHGPDAVDFRAKVREVLTGTLDPRVDMPEELNT